MFVSVHKVSALSSCHRAGSFRTVTAVPDAAVYEAAYHYPRHLPFLCCACRLLYPPSETASSRPSGSGLGRALNDSASAMSGGTPLPRLPLPLPLPLVLALALEIVSGLAYLHPTCIHRDLKPSE